MAKIKITIEEEGKEAKVIECNSFALYAFEESKNGDYKLHERRLLETIPAKAMFYKKCVEYTRVIKIANPLIKEIAEYGIEAFFDKEQ